MDKVVVQVRGLVQIRQLTAVDQVDFEVRGGRIFSLLGPNGAGKTTTFRMLCRLPPATSGTLRVAGMDLRTARLGPSAHWLRRAEVFQGQLTVARTWVLCQCLLATGDRKRAHRLGSATI
jgi:ABC-type multidrug transport system ATPase subunit